MSLKAYNPKSHAPAVYIPCWLSQVSVKELSINAKMLYGRIAQWSNSKGEVHRSASQLAEEMGAKQRSVERWLAELRDTGLIKTHQRQEGGVNYYSFLEHKWMEAKLIKAFDPNNNDDDEICTNSARGTTTKFDGGVLQNLTEGTTKYGGPKVKEIKENKKTLCPSQKMNKADSTQGSTNIGIQTEVKQKEELKTLCPSQATDVSAGKKKKKKKEKEKHDDFIDVWNNEMAGLSIGVNGAKHKPLKILTKGLKSIISEWINAKLTPRDMYIYLSYLKIECFSWAFEPRTMPSGRLSYPTFETFCRLTTYEKQTRRPEFQKHIEED